MTAAMESFGLVHPNLNGNYQKISLWLRVKKTLDERLKIASSKILTDVRFGDPCYVYQRLKTPKISRSGFPLLPQSSLQLYFRYVFNFALSDFPLTILDYLEL